MFEATLASSTKQSCPGLLNLASPRLRRPCASHLVTPRLEPTHCDKANKACQKKEPAVSLSDRRGGDGSGPQRPLEGFSGHGNKARRMLGKDRVDALHPKHHGALPIFADIVRICACQGPRRDRTK